MTTDQDADTNAVAFEVPEGAKAKRWRAVFNSVYSDWSSDGMDTSVSGVVTVQVQSSIVSADSPFTPVVVLLDIGSDILTQSFYFMSDNPLQIMTNSFVTMPEALTLAASKLDISSFMGATYSEKAMALSSVFDTLASYRYFIYYEQNDWGARNRASFNLPYIDDYESINDLRNMTQSDFEELKPDFVRRIKMAQIYAADDTLTTANGQVSPADADPNLLMEKIGDTSRTWKQNRDLAPVIGSRAKRLLSKYISSTPRLTRT